MGEFTLACSLITEISGGSFLMFTKHFGGVLVKQYAQTKWTRLDSAELGLEAGVVVLDAA